MRNIKLTIEYDGTKYDSWAKQPGSKAVTIQDRLEAVIERMLDGEKTELIGAARTEAGVHAYAQVACFKTESKKSLESIKQYINRYLPRDIAVLSVSEAPERFHPAFSAKSFEYEYKLTMGDVPSVFDRRYNYYCFKPLNLDAMRKAAEFFKGKHDMKAFSDNKRQKKSTVREIFSIEIYGNGNEASILLHADDFWPNMAKIIVGTLIEVGMGNIKPAEIKDIIDSGEREKAGPTMDSKGLFLSAVHY